LKVYGETDNIVIHHLCDPQNVDEFTLDWISEKRIDKQVIAESSKASAIIVSKDVIYSNKLKEQGKVLIVVSNPRMALAKIGNHFFVEKQTAGIHP